MTAVSWSSVNKLQPCSLESHSPDSMLTPVWGGSTTARRTRETKTAASSGHADGAWARVGTSRR